VVVETLPAAVRGAYAHCERLARRHYENFPVASRLLPAAMRPHVAAVYAFARTADDFADEGDHPPEQRLRQLDDWRERLWRAAAGEAPADDAHAPVFAALAHTIATHHLPVTLFEDLLSAFSQDVTTKRYRTWTDLMDYCRRSANPVGRLVLRIAWHDCEDLDLSSDSLCTGLQLANFWQDFARDWRIGRLYVPAELSERFDAREADLHPEALTPEWRCALEDAVERTRPLFAGGRRVCDAVSGRLRFELRLTWLGGTAILDRLAATGFEPHHRRPTLGWTDAPRLLWQAWRWPSA
jgi:hydroxysqualene synthase